jgi:hypothetical protein
MLNQKEKQGKQVSILKGLPICLPINILNLTEILTVSINNVDINKLKIVDSILQI